MKLHGIIPPVATPMQANEDLDLPRLKWYLDYLIGQGVHGLFVLGTNSEFYALDEREKQEVIATAVAHVNKRVPVFAGTGAETTREVVQLAEVARRLRKAPPLDRAAFADEVWDHQRRAIDELVAHGQRLARVRRELDGIVTHQAWETDVAAARRELAAWGRGWLRWLCGRYRRAMRTLQGLLAGPLPATLEERLAILDRLQEGQQVRRAVEAGDELGRRAFGTLWRGTESDWAALEAICQWEQAGRQGGLPADFRKWMARWTGGEGVEAALRQVRTELAPLQQELKALIQTLDWDLPAVFSLADPYAVPLVRWIAQLEACQRCAGELVTWCAYYHSRQRVQELGLEEVLRAAEEGQLAGTELLEQFDLAWCEALVRHAQAQFPELKLFDGAAHERLIEQFRQLDRQRQLLARQQVALAHWQRLPRLASDVGEVGLVRREIHKKRRHLPLRQLLKEAGRAVQQIKPVFLMSPLSVAQFLAPGVVEFDLLVIDEASQVRPVDALGAIARVRQMVVVGDDRQLPPTRFFTRLAADGDAEADEQAFLRTGDLESILGLCVAAGLPSRMLRWHYRSRHPSLIAVSNREFYEGRLLVVPSPQASGEPFGLRFHYLDQAVYDRGGTATNRLEAAAVAEAVLDFARRYPDQSLGVGTFSVAQRDAILDALEERRRQHPELEPFFTAGGPEPFFVKNLENIQGDERDVIF
ncbi:MAG: dihydrodipicolinate synthase family protein, partial [Chloroflexi bacterium]|nr:dihydrodipicolinate synthase family protein [Chloroflexota bacterium]